MAKAFGEKKVGPRGSEAGSLVRYLPAAHLMHAVCCSWCWNWPEAQSLHSVCVNSFWNLPLAHEVHAVAALLEYEPGSHLVWMELPLHQ